LVKRYFRVFGNADRSEASPPQERPLRIRDSFRVWARRRIARIGSAIPLCRWPFPRLCGIPDSRAAPFTVKRAVQPLFELRAPSRVWPTLSSRAAEASRLLSWAFDPYSTFEARRSTVRRPALSCYGPSSGFGYPRDGLRPPSPRRLCFAPAALLGFTLRSFPLSTRYRPAFAGR
jgi:hypothetical protein